MTIVDNYFPFDSGPGAAATAARWRLMARLFSGSGVVPSFLNQMNPTIAGSVVTIDTGAVWIDGYYGESDSSKSISVTGNGMVVARMDPNARQIILVFVPNQTTPTQSLSGIYEIPIMAVSGGSTGIDIRAYAVAGSGAVPSGTILDFGGGVIPPGFLACNGASYLRTSYPTLFAAIGTQWGSADANHFSVPSLGNRFTMGAGSTLALGAYGGSTTISAANMPPHSHGAQTSYENTYHQHGSGGGADQFTVHVGGSSSLGLTAPGDRSSTYTPVTGNQNTLHYHTLTTDNGPGSSAAFLPPAAGVTKMIKV